MPSRVELPLASVAAKPASSPGKSAVPEQARPPGLSRAEQLYQQSLAQNKQGQSDQAQKSLREALEIQPQHVEARLALAKLLVDKTQSNAAAELLADGVMLLPRQASFTLALAPLWFQSGQQDDALALLAQQAKSTNNSPQFHAYYASQLMRLKRHADAATQYRAALRDDPGAVDWLIGLGISLQGAGNNKEALETFRRAYETGKLSPEKRDLVEQMIAGLKAKLRP
ncbi:MAG: tetratricopeptide repeat protein [Polaromonas sp.]|nr:tetratricopeptide repeat protein [Polaromonas sp.]